MTAAPYPGTAIPELTEDQIKSIFLELDYQLHSLMLNALTRGIYTGVVAVTLWAIGLCLLFPLTCISLMCYEQLRGKSPRITGDHIF
ncbi:hypothetical protein ARMGADRAFT_1012512 [Armillaria gallica]|uniref:Uncharacterized protein n=1 Tax=Armillaria gallica TaxID=47427 RepID=A0A2H3DIM4_ARMGA|nr:hypothetical protein ARMGADRAFT_1012512 [Armillaria gallica]